MDELRSWLRTSSAYDVLDDAVMGSLLESTALDICDDFGVTKKQLREAIAETLAAGY